MTGITGLVIAAWRGGSWALVAAAGGIAVTLGWTIRWRPGRLRRRGPPPLALREVLDLVRQAYGASVGWAIGAAEGPFDTPTIHDPQELEQRRRGAALVQLASVDGRLHVVRDPHTTYVAVGDFPYGVGLALQETLLDDVRVDALAGALRRFVAGMRIAEEQSTAPRARIVAGKMARLAAGAVTLEGLARAAVQLGEQLTRRGVALAIAGQGEPRVVAVSSAADRRLSGMPLSPQSAVARAIAAGVPVAAGGAEDVFGPGPGVPERRRNERVGTAYPLLDGTIVVGALVVLGPPLEPDAAVLDDLSPLLTDLGPRVAAALAVHEAERRAVVDPLTGLQNRRAFEHALGQQHPRSSDPATLILVDLDHFKSLNDTLGHPAGDAALKHVARLLEAAVRDGDLVARIGGEEFAVWLPRTGLRAGMEVAERIRRSIAQRPLQRSGSPYPLSASCGIASYPELVGDVMNLPAAADAALYRAKELGRNRVEMATAGR